MKCYKENELMAHGATKNIAGKVHHSKGNLLMFWTREFIN